MSMLLINFIKTLWEEKSESPPLTTFKDNLCWHLIENNCYDRCEQEVSNTPQFYHHKKYRPMILPIEEVLKLKQTGN